MITYIYGLVKTLWRHLWTTPSRHSNVTTGFLTKVRKYWIVCVCVCERERERECVCHLLHKSRKKLQPKVIKDKKGIKDRRRKTIRLERKKGKKLAMHVLLDTLLGRKVWKGCTEIFFQKKITYSILERKKSIQFFERVSFSLKERIFCFHFSESHLMG